MENIKRTNLLRTAVSDSHLGHVDAKLRYDGESVEIVPPEVAGQLVNPIFDATTVGLNALARKCNEHVLWLQTTVAESQELRLGVCDVLLDKITDTIRTPVTPQSINQQPRTTALSHLSSRSLPLHSFSQHFPSTPSTALHKSILAGAPNLATALDSTPRSTAAVSQARHDMFPPHSSDATAHRTAAVDSSASHDAASSPARRDVRPPGSVHGRDTDMRRLAAVRRHNRALEDHCAALHALHTAWALARDDSSREGRQVALLLEQMYAECEKAEKG
eukprot:GEMP01044061.1.p1 GENE.GEMP01044061.1~~GEMP01044061.1.p1  ORF type:complete len:276 (+),score=68.36 GEMP01044061.1:277-1104(+)